MSGRPLTGLTLSLTSRRSCFCARQWTSGWLCAWPCSEANWRDRAALRALEAQIAELMDLLGLNPTGRRRLTVQTEESPFDELARRREAR